MHPTISLLHATYRRTGGPTPVRDMWLERASRPDLVEYIFALDADDTSSVNQTDGELRVVSPPNGQWVTAVRNWNAAAQMSTGDLLMVVADDIVPPIGWDDTLVRVAGSFDPLHVAFAVKVTDSPEHDDTLVRHPVISRAFYEKFGLFSDAYHGRYCDRDFTTRAFWRSVILDGRSLVLDHRHPMFDSTITQSESQERMYSSREDDHGRSTYLTTWPASMRLARVRLVPTDRGRRQRAVQVRLLQWWYRTSELLRFLVGRMVRVTRLAGRPRDLSARLRNR